MILFIFCVFCAIFLNTALAAPLGVESTITVAFAPFMLLIIKDVVLNKIKFTAKQNKEALILIFYAFTIIIIKAFIGQDYVKYMITLIIIPMLISMYLENATRVRIKILRGVLDFFFISNVLISIYERITEKYLFYTPTDEIALRFSYQEVWQFRSYALLAHPLANAMVICVIMAFVIVSDSPKIKKYIFFVLGLVSLFCFNARGAILITLFLILPYFWLQQYKVQRVKFKTLYVFFSVVSVLVLLYFIFNSNLGGRIANSEKLIDGSAETRLQVYTFYEYLTGSGLFWGSPDNYLYLADKLKAGGVENGVIVLIINVGLIFTPLLLYFLFKFQNTKLQKYNIKDKWFILAVFYIIGFMNPNLAAPIQWIIFIFAYYAYQNITAKRVH